MSKRHRTAGLLFSLPAALLYLPLVLVPIGYTLWLSLHRWNGLEPQWHWHGLGNYQELLTDVTVHKALWHNLALVLTAIFLQLPIAMGLAMLVRHAGRLSGIARTGIFVPYMLPTVIIALVWKLLVIRAAPELLGSTTWSLPLIIVVVSWRFIGFHMVLYLAGLSAIEPQLEEAAMLDGAGPWQIFRHVTLPLLRPVLLVSATLAIIGSIKYFDIVYVMTGGGPARSTELLATYMFEQGFAARRFGYASAVAVALTFLAMAGVLFFALLARRPRRELP